jgi:hypothetical protein
VVAYPTNVTATTANSSVHLSWNAAQSYPDPVDHYNIYFNDFSTLTPDRNDWVWRLIGTTTRLTFDAPCTPTDSSTQYAIAGVVSGVEADRGYSWYIGCSQ